MHVRNSAQKPKQTFACNHENCKKTFTDKRSLKRHSVKHLPPEVQEAMRIPCTYPGCEKTCARKDSLKKHMQSHTKEKPYACICGGKYNTNSNLTRHVRLLDDPEHHRSKATEKTKPGSINKELKAELPVHAENEPLLASASSPFELDSNMFLNSDEKNNNVSSNPATPLSIFSPHVNFSDEIFNGSSSFGIFSPTDDDISQVASTPFKPTNSQIVYDDKKPMALEHSVQAIVLKPSIEPRSIHSQKPFKCDHKDCNSTHTNISNLIHHKLLHLTREALLEKGKGHVCEYPDCGKCFVDKRDLARHMRKHTKEKPYECCCGQKYGDNTSLKTHVKLAKDSLRHFSVTSKNKNSKSVDTELKAELPVNAEKQLTEPLLVSPSSPFELDPNMFLSRDDDLSSNSGENINLLRDPATPLSIFSPNVSFLDETLDNIISSGLVSPTNEDETITSSSSGAKKRKSIEHTEEVVPSIKEMKVETHLSLEQNIQELEATIQSTDTLIKRLQNEMVEAIKIKNQAMKRLTQIKHPTITSSVYRIPSTPTLFQPSSRDNSEKNHHDPSQNISQSLK